MMRRTRRRKREHRQCLLLVLSPAVALLGVGMPLWVTSRLWQQQVAFSSLSTTTTTTTTTADVCNNNSNNNNICGRCPELIEAAKYYLHAQQQQQQGYRLVIRLHLQGSRGGRSNPTHGTSTKEECFCCSLNKVIYI